MVSVGDFVPDFDMAVMLALEQEHYDLFNEIIAMKAKTIDGLRCQIIPMWEDQGPK